MAASLSNLAEVYRKLDDTDTAVALHRESLTVRAKLLGSEHPEVAASLHQIGQLLVQLDQLGDAADAFERALGIRRTLYGDMHATVAESTLSVGQIMMKKGLLRDAEAAFRSALWQYESLEAALEPTAENDPQSLESGGEASNEAARYEARMDVALALDCLSSVLACRASEDIEEWEDDVEQPGQLMQCPEEEGFGRASSGAAAGSALAKDILLEARRDRLLSDAQVLSQRTLLIRRQGRGEEHEDVASSLSDVADICAARRRYKEAYELYKICHSVREKRFGEEHPLSVLSMSNVAKALRMLGRLEECRLLLEQCVRCYRRAYGETHTTVATALLTLAELLKLLEEYDVAEQMMDKVLSIRKEAYGSQHFLVAVTEHAMGELCLSQGRRTRAQEFFQRAVDVLRSASQTSAAAGRAGRYTRELALSLDCLAHCMEGKDQYVRSLLGEMTEALTRITARDEANGALRDVFSLNLKGVIYAREYIAIADALRVRGKLMETRYVLELSVRILRFGVGDRCLADRASALTKLSELLRQIGLIAEAEDLFQEASALCVAIPLPELQATYGLTSDEYTNANLYSSEDAFLTSDKME